MSTELVKANNCVVDDIQQTNLIISALLQTSHYKRKSPEELYIIVQKARSMGINPLDALNGGMYCIAGGKVEISAQMMNSIIRSKGHSIQQNLEKSSSTCCSLIGKRADNGDTWTVSFSIEDARRAGIVKENGPWTKYPEQMLFARALSKLARQLFADIIMDAYVEKEISDAPGLYEPIENADPVQIYISQDQLFSLQSLIEDKENADEITRRILKFLSIEKLELVPLERYDRLMAWVKKEYKNKTQVIEEKIEQQ